MADAGIENEPEESTTPDSVATAELQRFLASGLRPATAFRIRPERDTMVIGPQGTQLLLPANAWALPDSSSTVQVELQEFYTQADIVLAGLSTTAGSDLLETAGMVRLTATANGRPVRLRPGRYVHLRLPAKEAKPGMQLFEGVAQGPSQHIDWQLPSAHRAVTTAAKRVAKRRKPLRRHASGPAWHADTTDAPPGIPRPATRWPEYPKFDEQMLVQFKSLNNSTRRLRRSRDNSPRMTNALNRLSDSYNLRIVRSVSVKFTVDSAGVLSQITPLPNSDPQLAATASAALAQMTKWKPAELPLYVQRKLRFEHIAAVNTVQLDFTKSGKIFVNQLQWAVERASKPRAKYLKHELDSLLANEDFRVRYRHDLDSIAALETARQQAVAQAELVRLRTQFTDTSRAAITQAGVYQELSAQGMGWINCDRFTDSKPLVALRMKLPEKGAVTSLVFKDMNCVMRNESATDNNAVFSNVPLGKRATVVALRREKGITYLATRATIIGPLSLSGFSFHPVTIAELRAELANL